MKYFAYGSNIDEADLKEWCQQKGHAFPFMKFLEPVLLEGFKLTFNYYSSLRSGGAANLMPDINSVTYGLLFEVEDKDMEILREKESYPNYYNEIPVTVKSFKNAFFPAITYKVDKSKETSAHQEPTKYYLNLLISNAQKYGFPNNYTTFLRNIEAKGIRINAPPRLRKTRNH